MTNTPIDPKNITEATTLAELREQRLLLEVIALRVYPSLDHAVEASTRQEALAGVLEANVHHATGFYVGTGTTEAAAIEAAFAKLRQALLPEPLKQSLHKNED
jgi:Tfp pilus assembly protein PilE